ncbi:MAG: PEP-utilizing enzyme [Planctomycetota bacterium]
MFLERARRLQALKEEAKHLALHEVALLRRIALELGRRLGLDSERTFGLEPRELAVAATAGAASDVVARAEARLEARRDWASRPLPTAWSAADLERRWDGVEVPRAPLVGELRGLRVAGTGEVTGTVRVLRSPEEIAQLEPGEVLVARFTDPAWTPAFPRTAGIVTEVGGWLSHAAILARELGLPAIVGVPGATRTLRTGDRVRLSTSGLVSKLPPADAAPAATAEVTQSEPEAGSIPAIETL